MKAAQADRHERRFDRALRRMLERLPDRVARPVRGLLRPQRRWVRMPAGVFLIVGGSLGFLPILGFWMLPLGCVVLAYDVPPLKRRLAPAMQWSVRRWDVHRRRRDARERDGDG